MKILIAEDNIILQTTLKAALSNWGYEVICAANGEEAYAILSEANGPKLAIVDWEMPKMDGVTLCKKIRHDTENDPLYIILLTSRDSQSDFILGLESGADDYISKPFQHHVLKARLNVGRRIMLLYNHIKEYNRFQGVLEMAGAVCHEINQPLQILLSSCELLSTENCGSNECGKHLLTIKNETIRIGDLTRKIMNISNYKSKNYMNDHANIIDIDRCSIDL